MVSKRHKSSPRGSKEHYAWIWECCNCRTQGGMNVESTDSCPSCYHYRCNSCALEERKIPVRETGKYSTTGLLPPCDAPSRTNFATSMSNTSLSNAEQRQNTAIVSTGQSPPGQSKGKNSISTSFEPEWVSNSLVDSLIKDPGTPSTSFKDTPAIPLVESSNIDDPIYMLRLNEDTELLKIWHDDVLPKLMENPTEFSGLSTIRIARLGANEEESFPTILISIKPETDKTLLRVKVSTLFKENLRPLLRISFEEQTLRRTMDGQPPICDARNTHYQLHPVGGASIGIRHTVDCTATLGGYLVIDGSTYGLTVDHLVPDDFGEGKLIRPKAVITHASEQEAMGSPQWDAVKQCLLQLTSCNHHFCKRLSKKHSEDTSLYEHVDLIEYGEEHDCPIAHHFRSLKNQLFEVFPVEIIGTIVKRSYTRSRNAVANGECYEIEMDWALVSTENWPRSLEGPIRDWSLGLHFYHVIPEAQVKSCGRTSGNQTGQINPAMVGINQGSRTNPRFTQEWSIMKDPETSWEDWIEGGIGVDGDSGSWVIDRNSNALYGMVWARHGTGTRTICLFSPILDIIADIKEITGAKNVCLPGEVENNAVAGKRKRQEGDMEQTSPIHATRSKARATVVSEQLSYAKRTLSDDGRLQICPY